MNLGMRYDFAPVAECHIQITIGIVPGHPKVTIQGFSFPPNSSRHNNLTIRCYGEVCCEVESVVEICSDQPALPERRIERTVLVVSHDRKITGSIKAGYAPGNDNLTVRL